MTASEQEDAGTSAQRIAEGTARRMLEDDAASTSLGMTLEEVRPGYARVTMAIRPDMLNGFKMMHGGFTFTLADTAFAVACNSYNKLTVAQSCDVDFTNSAKAGDVLTAECTEALRRGRSGIYDVTVTNQDGTVIALFRGKSRTLGQPVDPSLPQSDAPQSEV